MLKKGARITTKQGTWQLQFDFPKRVHCWPRKLKLALLPTTVVLVVEVVRAR